MIIIICFVIVYILIFCLKAMSSILADAFTYDEFILNEATTSTKFVTEFVSFICLMTVLVMVKL